MTAKAKPAAGTISPEDAIDPSKALVPSVQRVNEVRVRTGFWPKIGRAAARIPFAGPGGHRLLRRPRSRDADGGQGDHAGGAGLFRHADRRHPRYLAGIGFTDDAAVITALIATLGANIRKRHRELAEKALDKLRDQ